MTKQMMPWTLQGKGEEGRLSPRAFTSCCLSFDVSSAGCATSAGLQTQCRHTNTIVTSSRGGPLRSQLLPACPSDLNKQAADS